MNKTKIVGLAVLGMMAGCQGQSSDSMNKSAMGIEKCYGIVKKGMNACGNSKHGCSGKSVKDGAKDEWVKLPKGLCKKLVGGNLKEG